MPDSSGRWRPAVAHEEIFLLSKSGDLFYDSEAVKKPCDAKAYKKPDGSDTGAGAHGSVHRNGREKGQKADKNGHGSTLTGGAYGRHHLGDAIPASERRPDKQRGHSRRHDGFNDPRDGMSKAEQQENGRLLRTYEPEVWHMATQAFSDAHFATFPIALVERCLIASCPKGGTVLDPFGGSGTVGLVAEGMGFDSVLIELNPEYAAIADNRIRGALGRVTSKPLVRKNEAPLFAPLAECAP